jgi:hypothetical protein
MLLVARIASALIVLSSITPTLAQEKSQQNAADEAAIKGDLAKAKDSGDRAAIEEAERQLELRAEEAKRKTDQAEAGGRPASIPEVRK